MRDCGAPPGAHTPAYTKNPYEESTFLPSIWSSCAYCISFSNICYASVARLTLDAPLCRPHRTLRSPHLNFITSLHPRQVMRLVCLQLSYVFLRSPRQTPVPAHSHRAPSLRRHLIRQMLDHALPSADFSSLALFILNLRYCKLIYLPSQLSFFYSLRSASLILVERPSMPGPYLGSTHHTKIRAFQANFINRQWWCKDGLWDMGCSRDSLPLP